MIRKLFKKLNEWLEDRLRSLVAPMRTDTRVIVIISMLIVFTGLSIYVTFSSIYNMGKEKGRQQVEIEHIERLQLQKKDSINDLKQKNYE